VVADLGFDEPGPLMNLSDGVPGVAKRRPIGLPRGLDGLGGVMKDIDVLRDAATAESFVQGGTARDVAVACGDAIVG
jgi:hypothetical protein